MIKEAVPYDYGGIDVIDELPLPSSKKTDPKKKGREDNASKTQSTITGPEEPSLGNVMTAAEDFIKVLATVSSSQSSSTSSDRGETQSSEKKKKRKNTGKKKSVKKQKGKGKWRKRKQKAEVGSKADEGTAASTSGGAGEVKGLNTFISEPHRRGPSRKHMISESEPVRQVEPLNEIMKDEPAVDKDTVSMTSCPATQKKPETTTEFLSSSTTTVPPKRTKARQLKGKGRRKVIPSPKELQVNTTDISVPTTLTASRVSRPDQRSLGEEAADRPAVSTARTPTVSPKVKRTRSEERGDREWRKKKRKDGSDSPTVATPNENNLADNLKAIPITEATAAPSGRRDGRTVVQDVTLKASYSVLKTQKMKERGLRSSRRKATGGKPLQTPESLTSLPTETSESTGAPTDETPAPTERLSPTITKAPSVTKNRHGQAVRGQRRSRKRTGPSAAGDGLSVSQQTERTTAAAAFTSTPPNAATAGGLGSLRPKKITGSTSASPVLSPVQLSVERLKAQFVRKKRRKTAARQH